MVSSTRAIGATDFSPGIALARVAGVGSIGAVITAVYLATGRGLTCPSRQLGFLCPFCGGTRMAAALVRGDLAAAVAFNPFLFAGSVVLALVCLAWLVELVGGPKLRLPARFGTLSQTRIYWVLGVLAAVFTVARNLL